MARYQCLTSGESLPSCGIGGDGTLIDLKRCAEQHGATIAKKVNSERRKRAAQLRRMRSTLRVQRHTFLREAREIAREQVKLALGALERELLQELEHESLHLALGIVARFLGEVLPQDERYLTGALRNALQKLHEERTIVLSYHPMNEGVLDKLRRELSDAHPNITFEQDGSIEPGKAILQTTFGSIRIDWRNEYEKLVRNIVIEFTKGRMLENT